MIFRNRVDAGRRLASALFHLRSDKCIVIAIPRGGVVVGFEVAKALNCPLDIVVPRKIGAPAQPELAVGAVAEDGTVIIDEYIADLVGVSERYLEQAVSLEVKEIKRRVSLYRAGRPPLDVRGMTTILVDDGLATGATMRAAVRFVRNLDAKKVIVAVPVAPPDTVEKIRAEADEVYCLNTPADFYAIGQFYDSFEQTTDEEVISLLSAAQMMAA